MDKQTLTHTAWECKYHIVFAPKYRRQAIYGKIKIDIGKISFYDENKGFGFIESKNNGSIYFHKTNFSNITCFLKTDTEVKFQFSKNLRQNGKCNYSVFKKTLEILG